MESNDVDPVWLTSVLRESGVVGAGKVESVRAIDSGAFNSQTLFLTVTYSAEVRGDAPTRLVLKRSLPAEWALEAAEEEARFYTTIAAAAGHPDVVVPCYGAGVDAGVPFLVLRDLSETHRAPVTRAQLISIVDSVPAQHDIDLVIDVLARVHAYWWEHPARDGGPFGTSYWLRDRAQFDAYTDRRNASWRKVIAEHRLPEAMLSLYETVLAGLPDYWERHLRQRFATGTGLTLVHGDAYFSNFLCPVNSGDGAYLLDWQSPEFDLAAMDLANLLSTFWTREQRLEHHRELSALHRYHRVLSEHGVTGYAFEDLITDYSHAIVFWLLIAVQDAAEGSAYEYWWPKMQCLVASFADHDCMRLFRS